MSRLERIVSSWLYSLRSRVPFLGERDPFNLRSSDALRDPDVRSALERWKRGDMSTREFRIWLDEKWEKDHE